MSLKCADLGALTAVYDVHAQWVQRLQEEVRKSPFLHTTCLFFHNA
jgi:hypothetical protein